MNKAIQILKCGTFAALIFAIAAVAVTAIEIRTQVRMNGETLNHTLVEIALTSSNLRTETASLKTAVNDWSAASSKQSAYWIQIGADVHTLAVNANAQLSAAGNDLHTSLAGETADLHDLTSATQKSLASITEQTGATSAELGAVLSRAAEQIENPDIANSLADIRDAAANVKTGTASLSASADDVRKVADYEEKLITTPISKTKKAALFVATLAGKFFSF